MEGSESFLYLVSQFIYRLFSVILKSKIRGKMKSHLPPRFPLTLILYWILEWRSCNEVYNRFCAHHFSCTLSVNLWKTVVRFLCCCVRIRSTLVRKWCLSYYALSGVDGREEVPQLLIFLGEQLCYCEVRLFERWWGLYSGWYGCSVVFPDFDDY